MPSIVSETVNVKLSICITTLNRADFIGGTLDSILVQTTNDCEVVVLDSGSTDSTERVVSEYASRFDNLRYIRQDTNNGVDRDYDRVVELALGEYCWLMTDDDLLKPGAVAAILNALRQDWSLVYVNVEFKNFGMSKVLQSGGFPFASDRVYGPEEMDRLFAEMDWNLWYIGSIVIRRQIWLARERQQYYGSWFVSVGVIFQQHLPGRVLVLAEPFISYRLGNAHTYSQHFSEIFLVKWPSLVRSLALSEAARGKVRSAEPWRNPLWLLLLRGWGLYSFSEYRRWIRPRLRSIREMLAPALVALLPGVVVNAYFVLYYSVRKDQGVWLSGMRRSRFYFRNWGVLKHAS